MHIFRRDLDLELASIEFFRFEVDHPESTKALWGDGEPIHELLMESHLCQVLNLFEMAVRFRRDAVMPAEVFDSWIAWMWNLCTRPVFHTQWKSLQLHTCRHYVRCWKKG